MIHKEAYLEIADKCYAKCHMCNMPNKKVTAVPLDTVKERLLKLQDVGFNQIRLTGKEPMTYPWFRQVVDFMKEGLFNIDMTTTLLEPDLNKIHYLTGFHKLRISLFAMYEQYRPFYGIKGFDTLVRNVTFLDRIYHNTIYFNYTLSQYENTGECNWSIESAHNIGKFIKRTNLKNYCFNIFPEFVYKEGTTEEMKDEIELFLCILDGYGIEYDYFDGTPKKMTTCSVTQHRLFVKHGGQVYPCCMTAGEVGQPTENQAYMGNIDRDPLHDIMTNRLVGLANPICDNCTQKYYNLMP